MGNYRLKVPASFFWRCSLGAVVSGLGHHFPEVLQPEIAKQAIQAVFWAGTQGLFTYDYSLNASMGDMGQNSLRAFEFDFHFLRALSHPQYFTCVNEYRRK